MVKFEGHTSLHLLYYWYRRHMVLYLGCVAYLSRHQSTLTLVDVIMRKEQFLFQAAPFKK